MRNLSGGGAEVFTFTTKGSDNLQMQWGPLVRSQQPNMKQGLDSWTGHMMELLRKSIIVNKNSISLLLIS